MDTVSTEQRSEIMSPIRSVNTSPELAARRLAQASAIVSGSIAEICLVARIWCSPADTR